MYSLQDDLACVQDMFKSQLYYFKDDGILVKVARDASVGVIWYSKEYSKYFYFCRKCKQYFAVDNLGEAEQGVYGWFWYKCGACKFDVFCIVID